MDDDAHGVRVDAFEPRRWANYFEVGYNAYEVVLHFGQFYAHNGDVQWHTRIVTHPAYAAHLAPPQGRAPAPSAP